MSKELREMADQLGLKIFDENFDVCCSISEVYEYIESALHEAERRGFEKGLEDAAKLANELVAIFNNCVMHPEQIGRSILNLKPPRPLEEKK